MCGLDYIGANRLLRSGQKFVIRCNAIACAGMHHATPSSQSCGRERLGRLIKEVCQVSAYYLGLLPRADLVRSWLTLLRFELR